MEDTVLIQWAAFIVAVGAALIALHASYKSGKAADGLNGLGKRLLAIEEGRRDEEVEAASKADLTADIKDGYLIVQNDGADASLVGIEIDGVRWQDSERAKLATPPPFLGRKGTWRGYLALDLLPPPGKVKITWKDKSGSGVWRSNF